MCISVVKGDHLFRSDKNIEWLRYLKYNIFELKSLNVKGFA